MSAAAPMLRSTLLTLSRQNWLRHWMEHSALSQKLTRRFVAGNTLDEALQVCERLQKEGISVTLDCLGENVTSLDEARISVESYRHALEEIAARRLPASVSIKLTQFGLDLSEKACCQNVLELVQLAQQIGTRVEIDMESTEYTDQTLRIVQEMHDRFHAVRGVVQAYLYRTEKDVQYLSVQKIPLRLCKGAYKEPPEVAYPTKAEVDQSYERLMLYLLDHGTFPAIASHDEALVRRAMRHAEEHYIPKNAFEFEMLYGIRRDLQQLLVREGYRLRLYVPYGTAWYPYFMRRLAERPANLLFLAKNLVRQ